MMNLINGYNKEIFYYIQNREVITYNNIKQELLWCWEDNYYTSIYMHDIMEWEITESRGRGGEPPNTFYVLSYDKCIIS